MQPHIQGQVRDYVYYEGATSYTGTGSRLCILKKGQPYTREQVCDRV